MVKSGVPVSGSRTSPPPLLLLLRVSWSLRRSDRAPSTPLERMDETERKGLMSSKRQQTMAKMARERAVKERRARKQEKKRERKLAAAAERGEPTVDETPLAPTVD